MRVQRAWTLAADEEPGEFRDALTRPYLGDDDRYVFPSIGGDTHALHPLLAWWAVLFALSLLARYQPDTWTRYLDVVQFSLLDEALVVVGHAALLHVSALGRALVGSTILGVPLF